MTAKEYLEQIRRLRVIVEQCKKEKAFLEHLQMMHLTNEQTKTHCQMLEKEVSAKIAELLPEIEMRAKQIEQLSNLKHFEILYQTSVYKGYKQDKIEMRGDRAEMSDFPLYLNMVAGGLDCRDQAIGGFSFVVKIYAVPVVEIIG